MIQYNKEELSALELALADLDNLEGSSVVEEVSASASDEASIDEALLEDVTREVELEEIVRESYEETAQELAGSAPSTCTEEDKEIAMAEAVAESDSKASDESELAPKPAGTSKAKSRAGGCAKPSEALKVRLGGIEAVQATLIHKPEDAKLDADKLSELIAARMAEIDKAPKKVAEKLVNAYAHLTTGGSLSVYTELALELILTKGEITSKDIFDRYLARPWSEGTARSQSGQLMQVLPMMGIAKREGQKLTLNRDSVMAQIFADKLGIEALPA